MEPSKLVHPPNPHPPAPFYYTPIFPEHQDQNYVVLLSPLLQSSSPNSSRRLFCVALILLLAAFTYIAWPSEPDLKVVSVRLDSIRVRTSPCLLIDVSLRLKVKVINSDLYSMDYEGLDVAVGYRGKMLGHVRSKNGHVRALGSSYVDAELEFDGVKVLSDVVILLEDLAKGRVPLDTVTVVDGRVGVLLFGLSFKAKLSCEILVNTNSQSIDRHNCYPEVTEQANSL